MKTIVFLLLICGVGCRDKQAYKAEEQAQKRAPSATQTPPVGFAAGMPQLHVGSSGFYLELGSLYERYQDPKTAADNFAKALEKAENPRQSLQALISGARVNEEMGNTMDAIEMLERASSEHEKQRVRLGSFPAMGGIGADDLQQRLGRLYVAEGRYNDAEQLYQKALQGTNEPYERDEFLRLEVELWRKAGTLDKRIKEREKALTGKSSDEATLRLLAIAYGGGMAMVPMPGVPAASADKLVRVYERLHELRPQDLQVRQTLLKLYEQSKRVEDALALVQAAAAPPGGASGGSAPSCPGGFGMSASPSPSLITAAETVRVLHRAGRADQALAETAKLVARGGVQAQIVGAQLYADQNRPGPAEATISGALKAARTPEEKRVTQAARADLLMRVGKTEELRALYATWKASDDACLRVEAARREQMLAQIPVSPPTRATP